MADDPDPLVRKTVSLPASVWRRIEDFQFANRIKRDTQAVRDLVEAGLTMNGHPAKPSTSADSPDHTD